MPTATPKTNTNNKTLHAIRTDVAQIKSILEKQQRETQGAQGSYVDAVRGGGQIMPRDTLVNTRVVPIT
jgi:hypothetical protein